MNPALILLRFGWRQSLASAKHWPPAWLCCLLWSGFVIVLSAPGLKNAVPILDAVWLLLLAANTLAFAATLRHSLKVSVRCLLLLGYRPLWIQLSLVIMAMLPALLGILLGLTFCMLQRLRQETPMPEDVASLSQVVRVTAGRFFLSMLLSYMAQRNHVGWWLLQDQRADR